ncbi:MAG: hypothetical protein IT310_01910 [Anaerolineales bacterium]|nr:hypothetical protein [Anaerolineales bacterium]
MTSPNPFSEKDIIIESIKQVGGILRSIVSKLSGQYVLIFGIALLIITAVTGVYIAMLESPAYEILWLPYCLLGAGIVIIILWFISNKIQKNYISPHLLSSSSEKFTSSLRKKLRFLDEITNESDADQLIQASEELVEFIENLPPNGKFYAKQIKELTRFNGGGFSFSYSPSREELDRFREGLKKSHKEYRLQLQKSRNKILALVDEFLQVQ